MRSVHPLVGSEMRAFRRLHRESAAGPFVFLSERGAPFTTACRLTAGLGFEANGDRLKRSSLRAPWGVYPRTY